MKKRILCLFLGIVMVLSAMLVSCSSGEDEEGADVNKNTGAKTITLSLITEKKVCNTDEELAEYLENVCGGDKESAEYKDMLKTMAAYEAVEKKISEITKSQKKTNVDIFFYTQDEYREKLEQSMAEYAYRQQMIENAERALDKYIDQYRDWLTSQGYPAAEYSDAVIAKSFYKYFPEYEEYKADDKDTGSSDDVYQKNDLGIPELVYPEAEDGQLDVIYLSGYDMYSTYIENEWLAPLAAHIGATGKQLTYNISPSLLNGVKVNGETYAIPNNVMIGEYTYMLVDKELADKYKYLYGNLTDLVECRNFIKDVTNESNRLPINATFDECVNLFSWYWNIDVTVDELELSHYSINKDNKFSLIGTYYDDVSKVGRGEMELGFNSLFANEAYRNMYLCLKEYEYNDAYKKENDTRTDPAVTFIKGDYTMQREARQGEEGNYTYIYEDDNGKEYYMYIAKYPQVGQEELYGNMFGISSTSKNVEACMEVITLINTNSTVRNLLQYGIKEGEHETGKEPNYTIDEETGELRMLNDLYVMDIKKTGNCFIAHPEEGKSPDFWEDAKAQNNDALIDPLLGFDFNERLAEYNASLDNGLLQKLDEYTAEILGKIEMCTTYAELEVYVNGTLAEIMSYDTTPNGVRLDKLTNKNYSTANGNSGDPDMSGESPYAVYYSWLTAFGYDVK